MNKNTPTSYQEKVSEKYFSISLQDQLFRVTSYFETSAQNDTQHILNANSSKVPHISHLYLAVANVSESRILVSFALRTGVFELMVILKQMHQK